MIAAGIGLDQGLPGLDFRCIDDERVLVLLYEVPGIGAQFGLDLLEKAGWAEQVNRLVTPEKEAKELIESDEMIHVHVGYEDMADLQKLPRGKMG